jgi:hypothetical protein
MTGRDYETFRQASLKAPLDEREPHLPVRIIRIKVDNCHRLPRLVMGGLRCPNRL